MQLPPIEVILSWPTPNYVDPKDVRGHQLLIITSVLFPIALATVALRTFTRVCISKSFGVDDWFLLVAVIPTAACAVLSILAMQRWGWNRHIWDVPPNLITLGLKLTITIECAFALAVSCTKLSMLILTRRVLSTSTGILHHIAAFGIFIVATDAILFCFIVIFACRPVSAYWTLSETPQKCINERLHLTISGSVNTFTDILVVFLPLSTMLKLMIPRRQQIILCGLFGAGFAICVAGFFRIYFVWKSVSTFDRTWASYGLWISSLMELYIGVICTSIPGCKLFFTRYLPALLGSSFGVSIGAQYSASAQQSESRSRHIQLATQEGEISRAAERNEPFELQQLPDSKFKTRINSRQVLPLSYLENWDATQERNSEKRDSHDTSLGSFIGPSPSTPSPNGLEFDTTGQSGRENNGRKRAESIEELVQNRV